MIRCLHLIIMACFALLVSCTSDNKAPATTNTTAAKIPALMQPFRFHKAIEVSPGQTYDVLSWGRGTDSVGAFAILHSDSAGKEFTTTTGDLNGAITDVYNSDMDDDGNPEIIIQSKGKDTINYTRVYAFEFKDNDANKLDFPKLSLGQKKGYRGEDNFYIRDGKLIREFPIFDGSTSAAKATGAKRQFEYSLHNSTFSVKQLSKDSVAADDTKAAAKEPVKTEPSKKVASKSKKKTKSESHKKKRRRRG
jgi:hypothetical protein